MRMFGISKGWNNNENDYNDNNDKRDNDNGDNSGVNGGELSIESKVFAN